MKSMCHFAAKIPAPHDHSNMLKIHAGPRNPPVRQSLIKSTVKMLLILKAVGDFNETSIQIYSKF